MIGGMIGRAAEAAARESARAARDAARARLQQRVDESKALQGASGLPPADVQPQSGVIVPAGLQRRSTALVAAREIIDGDRLLHDTRKFFRHFAMWPSEAALTVATLAAAAMHGKDPETLEPPWEYAFRLLITAADYGAGKSWFAKLIAALAPDGKVLLEPTKPSLIDEIGDRRTVVVTEVDELLATPGRNRGIVAVINASYEPGHYHTRKQGGKVQEIHLYGHMILDGLDSILAGTRGDMRGLVSRCIVVRVKMAPPGYRRPTWDKVAQALAARGRDRLAAFMAQEIAHGMHDMPAVPPEIGNPRRCALYEPLFWVALRADQGDPQGYWSTALADAAYQLEQALGVPDEDDTESAELDRIMASWDDEEGL